MVGLVPSVPMSKVFSLPFSVNGEEKIVLAQRVHIEATGVNMTRGGTIWLSKITKLPPSESQEDQEAEHTAVYFGLSPRVQQLMLNLLVTCGKISPGAILSNSKEKNSLKGTYVTIRPTSEQNPRDTSDGGEDDLADFTSIF